MQTVVELPEYQRQASLHLGPEGRDEIVTYLAYHPTEGVVLKGTGGVRKLRWAAKGKGKSGGVRVIYYFYNETMPLFLIELFSKGDKDNLSKAERNALAIFVRSIVQRYGH